VRLALLTILVGFAPASALADDAPSFQVIDRGTAVEVVAHNVTAARTGVLPIRSRLEVPLAGHPHAIAMSPKDATVKVVELEDGNLSVKVGYEHAQVIGLAKFAQASQIGPDVHLIFPRLVPPDGTALVLPEPTIPAALARQIEAAKAPAPVVLGPPVAPIAAAATRTPAAPRTPEPAATRTPEQATKPELAAATRTPEPPKPEPRPELARPPARTPDVAKAAQPEAKASTPEDAWQKLALYGAIGLAGVGCGAYLLKKRRAGHDPSSSIDVIAQRSLGGKARIVWFTAGGREMVVAVTPQAVRMLGQWPATPRPVANGALPTAHSIGPEPRSVAGSSAVSGILRLREKAGPAFMALDSDIATSDVDADAVWAKEILAATGARR